MKKFFIGFGAMALIYCTGFLVVRHQLHDSTDVNIATDTGNKTVDQERTFIWIPGTGSERFAKLTLYWSFYPAGQIDHLFTGRIYDHTDALHLQI